MGERKLSGINRELKEMGPQADYVFVNRHCEADELANNFHK